MIAVGDVAPFFSLPRHDGKMVSLPELVGKNGLVLYFYPMDETPGCTREACGFRDSYQQFRSLNAEVAGISSQSVASHQRFIAHHHLPFTLLSDELGAVRQLYGVPRTLGLLPGRVTYVLDRFGKVRHITNSQLWINKHVSEALEAVMQIGQPT